MSIVCLGAEVVVEKAKILGISTATPSDAACAVRAISNIVNERTLNLNGTTKAKANILAIHIKIEIQVNLDRRSNLP